MIGAEGAETMTKGNWEHLKSLQICKFILIRFF